MEHRIIRRAEWGAKYRGGWGVRPLPAVVVALHKPVIPGHPDASATLEQDFAYARRVEAVGYARFGPEQGTSWGEDELGPYGAGVSYSVLVMRSGRILEGHDIERQSSHTAGHNYDGVGIMWEDGDDPADEPTVEQINATAEWLRYAVAQGYIVAPRITGGHRDYYPTTCPTDPAYKFIPTTNEVATTGEKMALKAPTHALMLEVERWLRSLGLTIYCGPSDWAAGRCRPGKHAHSWDSRHFKGLAIDFGFGAAAINDLEALIVPIIIAEIKRRWPGYSWRSLWNVGPGNHEDHGHVDDNGNNWTSVIRPRAGVAARDGVDLFVPVKVAPWHKPPTNHKLSLLHVQKLQDAGTKLGWYSGALDGYHGPQTTALATRVQKEAGLTVDGKGGPATLAAALKLLDGKNDPYASFTKAHIERVQTMLKVLGFYTGSVDGLPGPLFQAAVRSFQTKFRLDVDGLPGPATTAALERAYADATKAAAGPDYSSFTKADIEKAQTLLKEAGWYVGADTAIDGSPGPNFQKAMRAAQETLAKEGLYKDAIDMLPGPSFIKAITTYLTPIPPTPEPEPDPAPEPTPTPTPDPAPVTRTEWRGARGGKVEEIINNRKQK